MRCRCRANLHSEAGEETLAADLSTILCGCETRDEKMILGSSASYGKVVWCSKLRKITNLEAPTF